MERRGGSMDAGLFGLNNWQERKEARLERRDGGLMVQAGPQLVLEGVVLFAFQVHRFNSPRQTDVSQ
jgi:hypothetical protein